MIHITAPRRACPGGTTAPTFCGINRLGDSVVDRSEVADARRGLVMCPDCNSLYNRAVDLTFIHKGWPFQVEHGDRVELERQGLVRREDAGVTRPGSPPMYSWRLSPSGARLLRQQCPELFDYKVNPSPEPVVPPSPTAWQRLLVGWNA